MTYRGYRVLASVRVTETWDFEPDEFGGVKTLTEFHEGYGPDSTEDVDGFEVGCEWFDTLAEAQEWVDKQLATAKA